MKRKASFLEEQSSSSSIRRLNGFCDETASNAAGNADPPNSRKRKASCSISEGSDLGMSERKCRRCLRPGSTPNPIKCEKFPSDLLQFRTQTLCTPCYNFGQKTHRGRTEELEDKLALDTGNLEPYLLQLARYERDVCVAKGERVGKQRDYTIQWKTVNVLEESSMLYDEDKGVFWPLNTYLEFNKDKKRSCVEKNLVQFKGEDGTTQLGLILASSIPSQIGCIKMTKRWMKGISKCLEVGNSAQEYDKDQLDNEYKRIRTNFHGTRPTIKSEAASLEEERPDGQKAGLRLIAPRVKESELEPENSSDEEIDYGGGVMVLKKEKKGILADEGAAEKTPTKGAKHHAAVKERQAANSGGGGRSKDSEANGLKQFREIVKTEEMLKTTETVLKMLGELTTQQTYFNLQDLVNAHKKLSERLSPSNLALYMAPNKLSITVPDAETGERITSAGIVERGQALSTRLPVLQKLQGAMELATVILPLAGNNVK